MGAFYRRPQAPGLAGIFAMFQDIKGEKQLGLTYLEFSTEFETGHDLCTNNSTQLPPWPSQPDKIMYSLPQVQDAARLYQVHQAVITHHRELVRPQAPPGRETIANHLTRSFEAEYEAKVIQGVLAPRNEKGQYRCTFRGAYVMTWGLLWPVTMFRRQKRDSLARAILKSLDLPVDRGMLH